MTRFKAAASRIDAGIDTLLHRLSTFVLPILICLVSLYAFVAWNSYYPAPLAETLSFRAIEESGTMLTPAAALEKLKSASEVSQRDTRLSEVPFWFSLTVRPSGGEEPVIVDFPSRHAVSTSCWNASTLAPLGNADRIRTDGSMSAFKAGFALKLMPSAVDTQIVCRASFVGPARLAALRWPAAQLETAQQEYHRNSGLLDGGLIALVIFMLVTALILREKTYVLFAAWLFVNLRVGALSAGWDTQWLGRTVPPEIVLEMRLITVAACYVVTIVLFSALFKEDLAKAGSKRLLRVMQWTCIPMLVLSVVLPYKTFLPVLWVGTSLSTAVWVYYVLRILQRSRSRVALWYGASILVTLAASLYEVISAALGLHGLIGTINSVTAALSSSLLATFAVAEQLRHEHKQRLEAQAALQHTFDATPVGLFSLDNRGEFLSANPAMVSMLGQHAGSTGANTWARHFGKEAWVNLHSMVQDESGNEFEFQRASSNGAEPKRYLVKATLSRDKIEGSMQDVTEKSKAVEHLRFMANHDPLTKVLNRRGIESMLDGALEQLNRGKPLAVAYLDLDRFKLINALYGHAVGDEVLKQVCERVAGMLTGEQRIGRVGGDEFVIVLPDTPIQSATWVCRGIIDAIGTPAYRIREKALQVGCSIGLIDIAPGTQIKDVVATADRACREAKLIQRNGLQVYEKNAPAFHDRAAEFDLMERLSLSNAPQGLFLEMQPIMSLNAPFDSMNFEALVRMRDHDGSVIPAGRIISAAESSGRTGVIDRWVMHTVLAWLAEHDLNLGCTQFACMNLSGASLNDERFVQDVFAMLEANPKAASRLCLEITESVALHDMGNTRRFIEKVRGRGVKVALDDFGAGYTSFSYLKDLPADALKIDGSFIVNMNSHPANVAIVEAIVTLAKSLGMKTIAEWAEDNATVETLAAIGVDYVQGFVVARPQQPSRLLAATSSASFIQDVALQRYVRALGSVHSVNVQADLLEPFSKTGLH